MTLQSLPTLAAALIIALIAFSLSFGFFVGRSCAPSPSVKALKIEREAAKKLDAIEKERREKHEAIDKDTDKRKRKILDDAEKKSLKTLRKELLKGARP